MLANYFFLLQMRKRLLNCKIHNNFIRQSIECLIRCSNDWRHCVGKLMFFCGFEKKNPQETSSDKIKRRIINIWELKYCFSYSHHDFMMRTFWFECAIKFITDDSILTDRLFVQSTYILLESHKPNQTILLRSSARMSVSFDLKGKQDNYACVLCKYWAKSHNNGPEFQLAAYVRPRVGLTCDRRIFLSHRTPSIYLKQ